MAQQEQGTDRLLSDAFPEWHMLELCRMQNDPLIQNATLDMIACFGTSNGLQAVFYHRHHKQIYICPIHPALDNHFIKERRLYNGIVFCAKTGKDEKMLLTNNGPRADGEGYNDWDCLCQGCKQTFRKIAHKDI